MPGTLQKAAHTSCSVSSDRTFHFSTDFHSRVNPRTSRQLLAIPPLPQLFLGRDVGRSNDHAVYKNSIDNQ